MKQQGKHVIWYLFLRLLLIEYYLLYPKYWDFFVIHVYYSFFSSQTYYN